MQRQHRRCFVLCTIIGDLFREKFTVKIARDYGEAGRLGIGDRFPVLIYYGQQEGKLFVHLFVALFSQGNRQGNGNGRLDSIKTEV